MAGCRNRWQFLQPPTTITFRLRFWRASSDSYGWSGVIFGDEFVRHQNRSCPRNDGGSTARPPGVTSHRSLGDGRSRVGVLAAGLAVGATGDDTASSAASRGPVTIVLTETDGWFPTSGRATWNRIE